MTPEVKTILNQMRCGFIPNGYQKTILGIAPKTWQKARIDEVCRISSGSTPRRDNANFFSGDILWVTSGELKNKYIVDTAEKISAQAAERSHLQMYEPGTVVIAIYGLEAAGVRGTASIVGKKCTISQACMAFNDFRGVDNKYFYYWYLYHGQTIGRRYAQGTKQQNLSTEIVGAFPICFPAIAEQKKIVEILDEQDLYIELSTHKIEQLQQLKKCCLAKMFPRKGAIAPEIRFPEFTNPWKQRKLGDIFDILQNNTISRADLNAETGVAKNVHYGDILTKFGEYLDASNSALPYIPSQQIVDKFKGSLLQDGDVIMADTAEDETVGKSTEIAKLQGFPTISGLHTIPLRPKDKFATGYLGYYMNSGSYHDQLLPLMQGIKVTSVSKGAILNTDISYPADSVEQAEIGGFFIRLDNLITLHQRKRDEEVKKKKALMQLLLTGIVRVS